MSVDITTLTEKVLVPVDFSTSYVDFGKGIVSKFSKAYYSALSRKANVKGARFDLTIDEIEKYLNSLLVLRINITNGNRVNRFITNQLNIPALFGLTLLQIGRVFDKDFGISLEPKVSDSIQVLSEEELIDISLKFQIFEDFGFELVRGIPKEITGSPDFMYFSFSEDSILRHNKEAHPGYAVLAAFFELKQLDSVLTHRISYGLIEEYAMTLQTLIERG